MADLTTEWVAREAVVRAAADLEMPDSTTLMRAEIDSQRAAASDVDDLNTVLEVAWPVA